MGTLSQLDLGGTFRPGRMFSGCRMGWPRPLIRAGIVKVQRWRTDGNSGCARLSRSRAAKFAAHATTVMPAIHSIFRQSPSGFSTSSTPCHRGQARPILMAWAFAPRLLIDSFDWSVSRPTVSSAAGSTPSCTKQSLTASARFWEDSRPVTMGRNTHRTPHHPRGSS